MLPDRPYHDSEDVAAHVRHSAFRLSRLPFDHDGVNGLPLRRDVLDYVRGCLFKAEAGLIAAGGLPLPVVAIEGDGTIRLIWSQDGRHVAVWVPCHGVIVLERYTDEEEDSYLAFTLKSEEAPRVFDDEVESAFTWIDGDEG